MARSLPRQPARARIYSVLFQSVLVPTRLALDGLWHLLFFVIGGVVIGNLLVNVTFSMATSGTTGLADPRTWLVVRTLLAHPSESALGLVIFLMVAVFSFVGHALSHRNPDPLPPDLVEMYNLGRVNAVSPMPRYIPQYRTYYIPRRIAESGADADQAARLSLRAAANSRASSEMSGGKVGFTVTGRRMLGTTRLAWQAMKAEHELGSWTFVDWPVDSERYGRVLNHLHQQNVPAVIWLDNLGKYLNGPNARILNYLPYALEEHALRYIIIATCRDQDYPAVKTQLGDLLTHLDVFPLGDITSQEADGLIAELSKSGTLPSLHSQYDGTPGSLTLGVTQMRDVVYPKLSAHSKQILRAIKLLQSVGVDELPTTRVLSVATALFAPGVDNWTPALNELTGTGFIGQRATASGDSIMLDSAQAVYIGVAVLDYTDSASPAQQDWPRLQDCIVASRDAKALLRLADAWRAREDDAHAEQCYAAALRDLPSSGAESLDWALARLGYAIVLSHRLDQATGDTLSRLMEESEKAFRDALAIITEASYPDIWAEAQSALAAVVRQSARTTRGPVRRRQMLDEAAANCRAALRILRKESTPEEWADAQLNLALTLQTHAQVTQDARVVRDLLDSAIAAHRKALEVFDDDSFPAHRARTQRYLGEALLRRTESSTRKAELYEESVAAFSNALALRTIRPMALPLVDIQNGLGAALSGLAAFQDGTTAADSFGQAADAYGAAADEFRRQQVLMPEATARYNRGVALRKQANSVSADVRPELRRLAIQTQQDTLVLLGRQGSFEFHAQLYWELANLFWERVSDPAYDEVAAQHRTEYLEQVISNAGRVIDTPYVDPRSAMRREARQLLRDATGRMKDFATLQPSIVSQAPNY